MSVSYTHLKISDKKADKKYHALFIENEYIKGMVLPELGGRIHMAYDKVKKRHFVYYNQVVKMCIRDSFLTFRCIVCCRKSIPFGVEHHFVLLLQLFFP